VGVAGEINIFANFPPRTIIRNAAHFGAPAGVTRSLALASSPEK
jgi:hypothetical protein